VHITGHKQLQPACKTDVDDEQKAKHINETDPRYRGGAATVDAAGMAETA